MFKNEKPLFLFVKKETKTGNSRLR